MNRMKSQDVPEPSRAEPVTDGSADSTRRKFIKTSATAVAAGVLLRRRSFAATRPIKIGYVSPQTGALAPFGETDPFVIDTIRKLIQGGIQSGGTTRPVEILVRDSQSSQNRCAEVASSLIKSDKVDMVLVASTPDTVNPVADQCEINQLPCVSSDAPWQPYFFGRGGNPDKGFDWTYHFFWGVEVIGEVYADICDQVKTNKILGILQGDDIEGNFFADPVKGYPPFFRARGYKVVDPGRFALDSNDFSAVISTIKRENVELLQGSIPLRTFSTFWTQAAQQNYHPKVVIAGKACEFTAAIEALGPRGKNISVEVWWTPAYPFKSSLTGQSAMQLCEAYEAFMKKEWTMLLGFRYALFEVALDAFKRARNPESSASVIEAVRATKINSVAGPIQWQGTPPDQWTKIPNRNVCTTPLVGGQWVPGKKWMYDLAVVDNRRYPLVPVQRKMVPLEYK